MARRTRLHLPGRLLLAAGAFLLAGSLRAFLAPRGACRDASTSRNIFRQPDFDDGWLDEGDRSQSGSPRGRADSIDSNWNGRRDNRRGDSSWRDKRVDNADRNTRPGNYQRHGRAEHQSNGRDRRGRRSDFDFEDWDSPSNRGQAAPEEPEDRSRRFTPAGLTLIIKKCESDVSLMKTIDKALQEMNVNAIHVAATFSKLASLRGSFNISLETEDCLQELTQQGARLAARRDFRARESASVLMAAASLRKRLPYVSESLVPSILKFIPEQARDMTPQGLSNTIWAIGEFRLESEDSRNAMRAAAQACLPQLGRFSIRDLAQTAWGLGAWGDPDEASELLDSLVIFAADLAPTMDKESAVAYLPQIALSLTRLGFWKPELMDAIARRLTQRDIQIRKLPSFNLAALNWAWMQPCSPVARLLSESATGGQRQGNKPSDMLTSIWSLLKKHAEQEGLSPEDIERSLEGPKHWTAVEKAKGSAAGDRERGQSDKVPATRLIEPGSINGTIQSYNPAKGYGFIATTDFKPGAGKWRPGNVFFMMSQLPKKVREYELSKLQGIPVSFNIEDSGDGRKSVKDWSLKLLEYVH